MLQQFVTQLSQVQFHGPNVAAMRFINSSHIFAMLDLYCVSRHILQPFALDIETQVMGEYYNRFFIYDKSNDWLMNFLLFLIEICGAADTRLHEGRRQEMLCEVAWHWQTRKRLRLLIRHRS